VRRDFEPPCGGFARRLFPNFGSACQPVVYALSPSDEYSKWRTSPDDDIRHTALPVTALYSAFYAVDSVVHLLPPWNPDVTLKIDRSSEKQKTILRLSGRIDPEGVLELKRQLEGVTENVALDLKEVIRVDLEAVRFLGACVVQGIELRNCPPYISEWIRRER
jgi:hypothetical protein